MLVVFIWECWWCLCERVVVVFMWENGGGVYVREWWCLCERVVVQREHWWWLCECWWCLSVRVVVQKERWWCLSEKVLVQSGGGVYVRMVVVFMWESGGGVYVRVLVQRECWWCLCESGGAESDGGVYMRECWCRESDGVVYVRVLVVFMWECWWCLSEKVLVQRVLVVFMWECWWCLSERVLVMLGLCMSVPQLAQVLQVRLLLSDHLPETSRRSDHDLRPAHQNPLLLLRSHPSDHDRCPDPCSTTRLHVIIGSEPEHQMMTGNTANAHDLLSGVLTCLHAQFRFQSDWINSDWWTWM